MPAVRTVRIEKLHMARRAGDIGLWRGAVLRRALRDTDKVILMRLFRALDKLSTGQQRFDVFTENALKPHAIKALLQRGVIVEVRTPPLAPVLPLRADALKEQGINTIEQLLDSDFEEDKAEILEILTAPASGCQHCGG